MTERKQPSDYKERFEFRFMVEDNIICQRYFRIMGFRPESLNSMELVDAMQECVRKIKNDLNYKCNVYTSIMSPMIFKTEESMREHMSAPSYAAGIRIGEAFVIEDKSCKTDFIWDGEKLVEIAKRESDREFIPKTEEEREKEKLTYKLSFYENEKEVISVGWREAYPKEVKKNIDLTNRRGRFEGEDTSRLSFEMSILHAMTKGREDLVGPIVKTICEACSGFNDENYEYMTYDVYTNDSGSKKDFKNYDFAKPYGSSYTAWAYDYLGWWNRVNGVAPKKKMARSVKK